MQLSISAEVLTRDISSGEEKIIRTSTGMIGPSVESIVEAIVCEGVRDSLKKGCLPKVVRSIKIELLDPEEVEPRRFKKELAKDFPEIF